MKNLWFKRLSGHVRVRIIGTGAERFINKLIRENVQIWHVKRIEANIVSFRMFISDIPVLRKAVHYNRVKVRFEQRSGLPFIMKRMRRNGGIVLGSLIALFIIMILSNMIWKIDINGASPELEYRMNNQLKEMGVRVGGFQFFVDDPEGIQKKLTEINEDVTWIGVELNGTAYRFQVVEKEQPAELEKTSPRHLVSSKEAIIVDYFVEKGEPVITINELVKPGQLLVSGLIGNEEKPELVSAKGEVFGKTWYNTEVEVALTSEFDLLTGEDFSRTTIDFGNFSIPIWGFDKEQYSNEQVEKEEKQVKFLKWTLPISISNTTVKEVEVHEKKYTEKEAKLLARELAKRT